MRQFIACLGVASAVLGLTIISESASLDSIKGPKVAVEVDEQYQEANQTTLDYKGFVKQYLEVAGGTVNASPSQSDAVLLITVKGKPLADTYQTRLGNIETGIKTYWAGVVIDGSLRLSFKDGGSFESSFRAEIDPPADGRGANTDPNRGAPFNQALEEPGSFKEKVVELLCQAFKRKTFSQPLIQALYTRKKNENSIKYSGKAAELLGWLRDPDAEAELEKMLREANNAIRLQNGTAIYIDDPGYYAAEALGRMGCVDKLIKIVVEGQSDPRQFKSIHNSIIGLGLTRDRKAIPVLVGLLDRFGSDPAILQALRSITGITNHWDAVNWRKWWQVQKAN